MPKPIANSDGLTFAGPSSRPPGVSYQNASTQYSPVSAIEQTLLVQAPAKHEGAELQGEPQDAPSTSGTISGEVQLPSTITTEQESPNTRRRRPFEDTLAADSISATAVSYPPKRTKPSETTAKILPIRYELCTVEDMVKLVAYMISELIETNDNLPLKDVELTRFHSRSVSPLVVLSITH